MRSKLHLILGLCMLSVAGLAQRTTIAEARALDAGTVVTLNGVVLNGPELGNSIRYFDDGTAGIAAYGSSISTIQRGDSITITGTLKMYNQLLELDPVASFTIHSSNHSLPAPILITPSQIGETYEGRLIKIEDAVFANAGGNFSGNTNYNFTSNGESGVIRVVNGNPLVGTLIPSNPVNLVTVVSQFSTSSPTSGYQLLPRDGADITSAANIALTSPVKASLIETNSVTIEWTTDTQGTTEAFWGYTPALEMGSTDESGETQQHQLVFSGTPAKLIYVNAFSVKEGDTAYSGVKVFCTRSLSSGETRVFFNHSIEPSVANGDTAIGLTGIVNDTIIAYINRATTSLDITMYDVTDQTIIPAINAAFERGVVVRYITDIDMENLPLENLNPSIPVWGGNADGIMHDKFIVIDRESVNNCWVMTGSTNHTTANLFLDYNNLILVQDQSLARAFTLEFNEMWGSESTIPNATFSRFGSLKTDNTPHQFVIDNHAVELYFSPSDGAANAIRQAINTSDQSLEFGVLVFTDDNLGNAVKQAFNSGVDVKGIVDYVEYSGSEFQGLTALNMNVFDYQNADGSQWPDGATFHHKYAIIDHANPASDPILVTGSHNWSAAADSKNDENTIVFHNGNVAKLFHQEFTKRYFELLTPLARNDTAFGDINEELTVSLIANDFVHIQVSSTTVDLFSQPTHGAATITNNILHYVPETNFYGTDSLSYTLCNGSMNTLCSEAWVYLTIIPDLTIVANPDSVDVYHFLAKGFSFYNLLANDTIPEGNEIEFIVTRQPQYGTVSYSISDTVIRFELDYFPADTFPDSFQYAIRVKNFPTIIDTAEVFLMNFVSGAIYSMNVSNFSIFPNPASNFIEIQTAVSGNAGLKISDLTGRVVYSTSSVFDSNGKTKLTLDLSKGIYMVYLQHGQNTSTKKLVIQ